MFRVELSLRVAAVLLTGSIASQACDSNQPAKPTKPSTAPEEVAKPDKPEPARPAQTPEPPAADGSDALAKADPALPLALVKLLGKAPPDVEALLGEHKTKGARSGSCVRFVPNRVFFKCSRVWQTYADKTDRFRAVEVMWEDALSASVAFDFKPSEQPFTREGALAMVGLELPGKPGETTPAEGVTVWRWFNNTARLLFDDKQHIVELSTKGSWETSRLTVTLNHPLTAEQQQLVVKTGGQEKAEKAAAPAPKN
ncbi:MAG: hypothetical protein ACPG77_00025 [Nannocystaceae bacterium]